MKYTLIIALLSLLVSSCTQTYHLPPPTTYNYADIDSLRIFYREAGDTSKPTIVLLHGYPASSHSYRNLIPMLSTHYHVIAPDNLGSGYSSRPSVDSVEYSFEMLAEINNKFLDAMGVDNYTMYMQDFGAPVGYRMMMKDPSRIDALIVQNANTYLDGLTPARQEFFRSAQLDTSTQKQTQLYALTSEDAIINKQYLFDIPKDSLYIQSPDAWVHDLNFLRSHNDRLIQVRLFQDYNNNLLSYDTWQEMLRAEQPPTLIVWGAKDLKFNKNGAIAYLRDLPNAELHLIDAGHFAVEEKPTEIAGHILRFLDRNL